ncbi:hypothetical protein FRC06_003683 [Ceratobasidium sp. 370]|nr:hypothetical protein FRC06_003683 [Ceratobasidium sp. 370]
MARAKKNKQKPANSSTNTTVQETPTKPQPNAKAPAVAEQAAAAGAKKQSTSASKADQGAGAGRTKTAVVAAKGGAAGARTSAAAKKAPAAATDEMDVDGPTAEIAAPAQDVAKVGTRRGRSSTGADSTTLPSKRAKVGDGGNAGDGDHGGKGRKADGALVGTKGKGEGKGKGKGKGKDTGEANDDEVQSERENEDEGGGEDDEDEDEDEDEAEDDDDDDDDDEDDEREQREDQDYEDGDGEDQSERGKDVRARPAARASEGKRTGMENAAGGDTEVGDASWTMQWDALLKAREVIATRPSDVQMAESLAKMEIGSAFIRACGPGDLHGVFDFDDPLSRLNPRPTNPVHVDNLYNDVFVNDRKRDHLAPILLEARAQDIDPELRAKMKASNARDPTSQPPRLSLVRSQGEEEDALELMVWTHRDKDGSMLKDEAVLDAKAKLKELRSARRRVSLLNGNHRLHIMHREGGILAAEHTRFATAAKTRALSDEEKDRWAEVRKKVEETTWRVVVYDADLLTEEARHALTKNDRGMDEMGMGAGEEIWWTANRMELWARDVKVSAASQQDAEPTRAEVANSVHETWVMSEFYRRNTSGGEKAAANATLRAGKRTRGKQAAAVANAATTAPNAGGSVMDAPIDPKHEAIDNATVTKMFDEPACWELLLDTKFGTGFYHRIATKTLAKHMAGPWGANLLAKTWLALRTVIMLYSVTEGPMLTDAESFIAAHPPTPDGDEDAARLFEGLMARSLHDVSPPLLSLFTPEESRRFGDLYNQKVACLEHPSRGFDYESPRYITALRQTFEAFALGLPASIASRLRPVRVAMQLYCRLPTRKASDDSQQGDSCFFPTAPLPAVTWMMAVMERWTDSELSDEGLATLETLLDRNAIFWTIGAQGNSRAMNTKRWYERARGLQQIVLKHLAQPGPLRERLSKAVVMLEDGRLIPALKSVGANASMTLTEMIQECGAAKSASAKLPYAEVLISGSQYDSERMDWRSNFAAERKLAKDVLHKKRGVGFVAFLRANAPIMLHVAPETFWKNAHVWEYADGWGDVGDKVMSTMNSIVGWGMVVTRFTRCTVQPALKKSIEARHLLKVAVDLCALTDDECWAESSFPRSFPKPPKTPPPVAQPNLPADEPKPKRKKKAGAKSKEATPTPQDHPSGTAASSRASKKTAIKSRETIDNSDDAAAVQAATARSRDATPKAASTSTPALNASNIPAGAPKFSYLLVQPLFQTPGKVVSNTPPGEVKDYTLREGEHDAAARLADCNPGHVYVRPQVPTSFLPNFDGFIARRDTTNPSSLETFGLGRLDLVDATPATIKETMEEIERLRNQLRDSLRCLGKAAKEMPFGDEFSQLAMAPAAASLKDIFVGRVAQVLQHRCQFTDTGALSEALLLAESDGLWNAELLCVNAEGSVCLRPKHTFPRGRQDQVDAEGLFFENLGPIASSNPDMPKFMSLMQYFLPVRGQGATELEASNRGALGAVTMSCRQQLRRQQPNQFLVAYPPINERLINNERWNAGVDSLARAEFVLGMSTIARECIVIPTARPLLSCFSTGEFARSNPVVPALPNDATWAAARKVQPPSVFKEHILTAANWSRKVWSDATQASVDSYATLFPALPSQSTTATSPLKGRVLVESSSVSATHVHTTEAKQDSRDPASSTRIDQPMSDSDSITTWPTSPNNQPRGRNVQPRQSTSRARIDTPSPARPSSPLPFEPDTPAPNQQANKVLVSQRMLGKRKHDQTVDENEDEDAGDSSIPHESPDM